MSRRPKSSPIPKFEHKARTHFQRRWDERIGVPQIPYKTLKELMQSAARGMPSTQLELITHVPPFSSRWRASVSGKTIVLVYDHAMKLPVSCWIEPVTP